MEEFAKLQSQVSEYDKKNGWTGDNKAHIVLHMQEELGEIAREILRHNKYKKENFSMENFGQEIVDLLYLTLKLANNFSIDVDKEWSAAWSRYDKKVNRR